MHIKFQNSPLKGGTNSGSCGALLNYLEKEDKNRDDEHELKGFFNSERSDLTNDDAKKEIEHAYAKKSVRGNADKFFSVTISFSEEELKGRTNKELMEFAQEEFPKLYANSVISKSTKEVEHEKLQWIGKLEETRAYKGFDDIPEGKKQGDIKEDKDNRHIHIVIARQNSDGSRQISPMTYHYQSEESMGAVKSGFDKYHMVFEAEHKFDERFNHERKHEDSVKSKTEITAHRPDLLEKFEISRVEEQNNRQEKESRNTQKLTTEKQETERKFEKLKEEFTRWEKVKKFVQEKVVAPISESTKFIKELLSKTTDKGQIKSGMSIMEKLKYVEEDRLKKESQKNRPKGKEQNKDQSNDRSRGI